MGRSSCSHLPSADEPSGRALREQASTKSGAASREGSGVNAVTENCKREEYQAPSRLLAFYRESRSALIAAAILDRSILFLALSTRWMRLTVPEAFTVDFPSIALLGLCAEIFLTSYRDSIAFSMWCGKKF